MKSSCLRRVFIDVIMRIWIQLFYFINITNQKSYFLREIFLDIQSLNQYSIACLTFFLLFDKPRNQSYTVVQGEHNEKILYDHYNNCNAEINTYTGSTRENRNHSFTFCGGFSAYANSQSGNEP